MKKSDQNEGERFMSNKFPRLILFYFNEKLIETKAENFIQINSCHHFIDK